MLLLVHHGEATDARVDAQRPLTAAGQRATARLAASVRDRGVAPIAIWHSGKLRARQTAEAFRRACAPLAPVTMVRGLQPADPSDILVDRLAGETRTVLLVGHLPHLAGLLGRLTGRRGEPVEFPTHGLVTLVSDDDGLTWREAWRVES